MKMSATTVQRGLFGMFAGGLLAFGSAAIVSPVADASAPGTETDNCSVSAIADTSRTVSESTAHIWPRTPRPTMRCRRSETVPAEVTEGFRAYLAQPEGQDRADDDQPAGDRPG